MEHNVVVIGAGYAGLSAAVRAARAAGRVRVTLVNEREHFVERIRLHEVAAGRRPTGRPLRTVLKGTGVSLAVGRVTDIDTERQRVRLTGADGDREIGYDTLVYGLGSGADTSSVPGAARYAHTLAGLGPAQALGDVLPRLAAERATVAVVGGGLTGIETAAELAEARPGLRVRLVTRSEVGAGFSPRGRRHLLRVLDRLGVAVTENAEVAEVRADGVVLADGSEIPAGATVWTAGHTVPALARAAGIEVDAAGRVIVDGTQRSVSHPDVYAVGDAARAAGPGGRPLRMCCAAGLPMSFEAARAITARSAAREPRDLRFRYYLRCVSLGRRDGLVQFVAPDDTPHPVVITGRAAALVKETVVRGAAAFSRGATLPPARRPRTPVPHMAEEGAPFPTA
ncbi:NAD(P)/FAD-dependent oxidoreductase [Nocardiopsis sediminis]|uniref:NAD(P)/FAD-dependent oxidoreductase n=1 Tax=Nocardiopsis sediminis TaxID=1778267 RepID=A0ABV8FT69_9ACTN